MNALVIGGAECVWSDLAEFDALDIDATTIAVNDIGTRYPETLDYWATLHPSKFEDWQHRRADRDYASIGRNPARGIDIVVREKWPGSSGLYAVQIALFELGAKRVYLCGVPMTVSPHYFNAEDWTDASKYYRGWVRALPEIKGRVKSFSGWTRELLGHPEDWQ